MCTFIHMKKSMFATILIGCLVALITSVSYADVGYKPYKVSDDTVLLSKTSKDADAIGIDLQNAILNPEPVEYRRQWIPVDYSATKLPNHNLLPTSKLWLINCAIKFC